MQVEKKLMKLCPKSVRIPVKYHYQKVRKRLEKEILYLDKLLMDGKRAIDIGANEGLYSYALSKICEVVEAFEPQSWCTEAIIDYSEAHGRNINVYNVGLSNFNGSLNLYIPSKDDSDSGLVTGLASFREMEDIKHCVLVLHRANLVDQPGGPDLALVRLVYVLERFAESCDVRHHVGDPGFFQFLDAVAIDFLAQPRCHQSALVGSAFEDLAISGRHRCPQLVRHVPRRQFIAMTGC